jgi:2-polyprenyl-3-methyl-5-hydroxy-6-metoxy-1,4-benzoquinol methylase
VKKRRIKLAHKTKRLSGNSLREATIGMIDSRIMGTGNVAFPCLPSLSDAYVERLAAIWAKLGRRFSEPELVELRASMHRLLALGYEHSPHTLLVVQYEANPPPTSNLTYSLALRERSVESYYAAWSEQKDGAYFGGEADAKVLELARALRSPARVLDVGAGHGRNTLPLGRQGLRVDALELVPALCARLRAAIERESLTCSTIEGDVLADDLVLEQECYELAILSEVVSHLRSIEQVDRVLARLSACLRPGGLLLVNVFLTDDGFAPDKLLREASQVALSTVFAREELAAVLRKLPLEQVSDESALDYEREHLPEAAWPPTKWFESWASGRNVLRAQEDEAPFELRWLVFKKTSQETMPAA